MQTFATEASKRGANFFGADSKPIPNLGGQSVVGKGINGECLSMEFDVAKISRPLASVMEIIERDNDVMFSNRKGGSYIQNCKSGQKTPLRQEGRLFFLDIWVEVPSQIANSLPFVRQSTAR